MDRSCGARSQRTLMSFWNKPEVDADAVDVVDLAELAGVDERLDLARWPGCRCRCDRPSASGCGHRPGESDPRRRGPIASSAFRGGHACRLRGRPRRAARAWRPAWRWRRRRSRGSARTSSKSCERLRVGQPARHFVQAGLDRGRKAAATRVAGTRREIADEVRAPVAAADDGDAKRFGGGIDCAHTAG